MPAINHQFSTALFHHRAGNIHKARTLYQKVLRKDRKHTGALHLLGLIASESGNQELALTLIAEAVRVNGPDAQSCANMGLILGRQGRPKASAACYLQALEFDPENLATWLNLGRVLIELRELEEARKCFAQILELSIKPSPQAAEAHFQLGNLAHIAGRHEAAAGHYQKVLLLTPTRADACFNLGVIRTLQNRVSEAASAYAEAIRLQPAYAEAHNNLGIMQQASGCVEEAAQSYQRAAKLQSGYLDAHYNLGIARQEQDHLEEALAAYNHLLGKAPGHTEARNNAGNVLVALNRPQEALENYRLAIQHDPDHAEARWNVSLVHLLTGAFEPGWEDYHWRFRQKTSTPRLFKQPLWDGSALNGRAILLHAEQGLGDTLQFIRYAELVKERGGYVIVECQAPLKKLLESAAGIDKLVSQGAALPPFECHAPLLSLPAILKTRLDSVPARVPYLRADAAATRTWKARMDGPRRSKVKAGIVWAGNPDHKNDRNRSVPVAELAGLAAVPEVDFISLQKGAVKSRLPANIRILPDDFADFADTAAAVMNLDLVISADTSVAHLAGALGKPVWVLLPFAPDWRWMLNRGDSPWYPGMRLFRQPERKNWSAVIQEVRGELGRFG